MTYKGWRNLKKSTPPVNELVELSHHVSGIGAPDREGWVSVGRLREHGKFSIKQNEIKTVDFRPPTHWRSIT